MQQDVALADGGENVLRTGRFDFGDLTIGGRNERTVLEIRTVDAAELEQHGRVKRRRQAVDLVGAHAQLVGEQLGTGTGWSRRRSPNGSAVRNDGAAVPSPWR